MKLIDARNVQQAFPQGMALLRETGKARGSRVGSVLEVPEAVCTTYRRPTERVLIYPERRANPFFHLMESLWMLAGRNDVHWLAQFNKKMADYSDDGATFHAAYGHRLRSAFGIDQLWDAIRILKNNRDDRRVVLQIWSADRDFDRDMKDIPCNDLVMLKVRNGELHMTIANRSNDAIWGCYGANAVHFSFFQEYLASMIGVGCGPYNQVSDSLHVYTDNPQWEKCEPLADLLSGYRCRHHLLAADHYEMETVRPYPLVTDPRVFDDELACFMSGAMLDSWHNEFFAHTVIPMWNAWFDREHAQEHLNEMPADSDWRLACEEWLT